MTVSLGLLKGDYFIIDQEAVSFQISNHGDNENVGAGYDMETMLPAIRCPVLLVQADPSVGGALRDEEVQRALHLLANPTHKRFSGMGHMLIYDPKGPPIMVVNVFLNQLSQENAS